MEYRIKDTKGPTESALLLTVEPAQKARSFEPEHAGSAGWARRMAHNMYLKMCLWLIRVDQVHWSAPALCRAQHFPTIANAYGRTCAISSTSNEESAMLQALINSAQPLINSVKCRCIQVPFGALYGRGNVHGFVCFVCVLFVCFLLYLRCQVLS